MLKESQGGKLSAREQKQLEEAETDIARVRKAREALGEKAPTFSASWGSEDRGRRKAETAGRGGFTVLGKRRREDQEDSSGSETSESVRKIPWPRDTPPPIPRSRQQRTKHSTNANAEPLGAERRFPQERQLTQSDHMPETAPQPKPGARSTYEGAPQMRDLKKEATSRFVPNAVKKKINTAKGRQGVLLQEEEVERLEKEGYDIGANIWSATREMNTSPQPVIFAAPDILDEDEAARRLREEEERFAKEMEMVDSNVMQGGESRGVRMEEISDEDR